MSIRIVDPNSKCELIVQGASLISPANKNAFPIVGGVPRLVPQNNYADSFGYQWNKFQATQLDPVISPKGFSKERFIAETGWQSHEMNGDYILEVGCGAGRFTQVVMEHTNAILYSIDYSDAVSVNHRNHKSFCELGRLHLFQASVYDLPFDDNTFDRAFCFGVLQHTPDFRKAIECIVSKVKIGGHIAVDFYPIRGWWTKIHAKYILRPLTKRIPHDRLFRLIETNVDWLIRLYFIFEKMRLGRLMNRFLPICDITCTIPNDVTPEQFREWVILDTFDMFSPDFDNPQRLTTVVNWFKELGVHVTFTGVVNYAGSYQASVIRGIKAGVA